LELKGDIVSLKGENIQQGDEIGSLKVEIVSLKGEIIQQGDEIGSLKVEIGSMRSYSLEERREKACKEIVLCIQDVNAQSRLENDSDVKRKGLSGAFRALRQSRYDMAHLFRESDPPDIIIYKKVALLSILENSFCLKADLVAEGVTSEVIAVVSDVLRNELKDVALRIPQLEDEVTKVDKFFKNTLLTLEKKRIQDIL
jgi:hypothetical protein